MRKEDKSYLNKIEPCNRCCSGNVERIDDVVFCKNCEHKENLGEWQLRGWRLLQINKPKFSGSIHVYGDEIGRTMANWDSKNQSCDNKKATHWLRVPDPKKQINFNKSIINKKMVNSLYDKNKDGILHFKNFINKKELDLIMSEVRAKNDSFEKKEEKYIENNQDVALIYRGGFDFEGLNNTVFEGVFKKYLKLRESVSEFSNITFEKGNIIEVKIIRYPISNLGVAAHKDLSSNINMITFFNLIGEANFYTYKDKNGEKINTYLMSSGDVSIMRGQRNINEEDIRPIHGVEEVKTERIVLAIREIRTDVEEIVNKGNWMGF